jgi:large subunit ribosomal protein L28
VWRPNVQWVRLWSDALETKLRLKVTTAALAVIDKRGGLDQYLLQTKPSKLGRGKAMQLREIIHKTMKDRKAQGEPATWLAKLAAEMEDDEATTEDDADVMIEDFELAGGTQEPIIEETDRR